MKLKILFTFFIALLYMKINGQIILEHAYDSASTHANGSPAVSSQLMIVKLEVSGNRYMNINRHGKYISIYDMNHSLLKTIDFSIFPQALSANFQYISYISEQLFDLDSGIEFMYLANDGGTPYTGIYNDDGTLIFSDSGAALTFVQFPSQQYPIYNTSQGTKMILSYQDNSGLPEQAKVFSLPGTLSNAIAEANGQLMQQQGVQGQLSNLYPNRSNGAVTLQYELPKGEQYGEIILYNMQGAEVKSYKVDNTFKDILLDNTMLPAGTYFYQLQCGNGAVGSRKMVIIR